MELTVLRLSPAGVTVAENRENTMRFMLFALAALASAAHAAPRPVIIGYLPTYKDYNATLDATDLGRVTHINIAFANPAPDGSMVTGDTMACSDKFGGGMVPLADIRAIVARAHKAGVKVLVSLGGGEIPACSGDWVTLLGADMRAVTVGNILQFVRDNGLDGVDIDLEWNVLTAIDTAGEYVPFIAELSAGLKKRHGLLTCATASNVGGSVPVGSVPYFDYVNIMSYDGVGYGEDGNIYGPPGGENASLAMAQADIAYWQARGVTRQQLVLGVPFYGHAFGTYRGDEHDYRDLLAAYGPATAENDLIDKACAGCSYITYNGRPTIRAKAALARREGAGVMIWELAADARGADSLLEAIDDTLADDEGAH